MTVCLGEHEKWHTRVEYLRRCFPGQTSSTSSLPPLPWLLLLSPWISRIRFVPFHCKYYHFYWATKYNLQARETCTPVLSGVRKPIPWVTHCSSAALTSNHALLPVILSLLPFR